MTQIEIVPANVKGFDAREYDNFTKLLNVFNQHYMNNIEKQKYYEGKVSVGEVNLGIALPDRLKRLEVLRRLMSLQQGLCLTDLSELMAMRSRN